MEFIVQKTIEAIKVLYDQNIEASAVTLQETRKEFEGDITLVVFPFTRFSKTSPDSTATAIGAYLKNHVAEVADFNVIKGFLKILFIWKPFAKRNTITISKSFFISLTLT